MLAPCCSRAARAALYVVRAQRERRFISPSCALPWVRGVPFITEHQAAKPVSNLLLPGLTRSLPCFESLSSALTSARTCASYLDCSKTPWAVRGTISVPGPRPLSSLPCSSFRRCCRR
eukprot:5349750-Prymnesium_polylepis.1